MSALGRETIASQLAPVPAKDLDLARILHAGDRILVGQGSGEPASLTQRLAEASRTVPGLTVCFGLVLEDTLAGDGALSFESYGALGAAARLPEQALMVLPLHYSDYAARIADGRLASDVVMVQLSSADASGTHHLGMGDLHLIEAARRARMVIAEINPATPRTPGSEWPRDLPIALAVESDRPPPTLAADKASVVEEAIAAKVAELVPDRAVLQFGIGRLPGAMAKALTGHRDLGLHSGVISDGVMALMKSGALTNAAKEIDNGQAVGGVVVGGTDLFAHVDENPQILLRPTAHTHSAASIAKLSRFCALNSAIEIDLLGQVNTETAGGRYVGGVGGQLDFTRAARLSLKGRAIVALPSTARGKTASRIVPRVETVSIAKVDADTVVTEWGVAELHGVPVAQRAERLIAIADPQFREDLSRHWRDHGRQLHG
jgi:acyl-CoA hydrolase